MFMKITTIFVTASINQLKGTYSEETLKNVALNEIRKKITNYIIIVHFTAQKRNCGFGHI